jgi:hypothetical protein
MEVIMSIAPKSGVSLSRQVELERAMKVLQACCSDLPTDQIDEVMLRLLNRGIAEDVAEEAIVSLFAARKRRREGCT